MIRAEPTGNGIWHVELRRPEKRNALGVDLYASLADAFVSIGESTDARVVVLSGQGPTFCAGNDLAEFETHWPQPPGGPVVRFLEALHRLPIPLVAAIQGAAVGIGATMLLHCDVVIAASDAFLQFPFVSRGIAPEGASSLLLPQRIGAGRAADILLTGRRVDAAEALALGLISRISRETSHIDAATAVAAEIAEKPKQAVVATKMLMKLEGAGAVSRRFEQEILAINDLIMSGRG